MLLVVLCLAVYLPSFFTIPVVDRDEARFAQASRQMMESGDYVVPRIQGRPRLNKPPLIYWLQSTSARALTHGEPLNDRIWMYRVPSLLAAIVAVMATWRMGRSMFSPRVGLLGAGILAACPIFFWEAHQARADMLLVACTTVALWMLWEVWKRETQRGVEPKQAVEAEAVPDFTQAPDRKFRFSVPPFIHLLILWLAIGASVMTKGPVTPMVVGLGVLALSIATRRWRWIWRLQPILGVILVAAMVGPWVWLVSRQVGWDTYISTIKDEVLGRSLEPKEGHGGFPGFHTILLPVLLFPGSVMIGVGLWKSWKEALASWRAARGKGPTSSNDQVAGTASRSLFLLAIILPSWLIFELVGTKLPHYTMPLYPLLALIAARTACVNRETFSNLLKIRVFFRAMASCLMLIPLIIFGAGVADGAGMGGLWRLGASMAVATIIGVAFCICVRIAYRRRNLPRLLLIFLLGMCIAGMMLADALPRFGQLWVSNEIVQRLDEFDPSHQRPIAAVADPTASASLQGYQEDSLIYLSRGRVERVADQDLSAWLIDHPRALVIVPADRKYMSTRYNICAGVDGYSYTKGRPVYLAIVEQRQ
jgi:4-amino-4-deoxy-L-arabinose transferase-like glycosyltransferase